LHTLIASLAFATIGSGLRSAAWVQTGRRRSHLQTHVAMIDRGLDIQEALEAPRLLSGRFAIGEPRDRLHIDAFPPGPSQRSKSEGI
jgi:gamma-glutamyltranspeptidase/glutathione hydrolase